MVVNNFPMHEVRAIGLKLLGEEGSCSAVVLLINLTAANFHCVGTVESDQQQLNRSCRAVSRDGHFNTV